MAALFVASLIAGAPRAGELPADQAVRLPEFTQRDPQQWLNSPPLRVADLAGSVVLLDFWTFDCVNCYRSIPWIRSLEQRFGARGLRVVGIHTPELPQERVRANVVTKLGELHITHPVMLDNDYRFWSALGNQYWPAFYLVDRHGRVRALFVGETHDGDDQARKIEAAIVRLLDEPAPLARLSASTR